MVAAGRDEPLVGTVEGKVREANCRIDLQVSTGAQESREGKKSWKQVQPRSAYVVVEMVSMCSDQINVMKLLDDGGESIVLSLPWSIRMSLSSLYRSRKGLADPITTLTKLTRLRLQSFIDTFARASTEPSVLLVLVKVLVRISFPNR